MILSGGLAGLAGMVQVSGVYYILADKISASYGFLAILVAFSGAMSGLGGAYLPLAVLHGFSENMTAGRGFIALCIVIFGGWNPWWILGGSLLFAFYVTICYTHSYFSRYSWCHKKSCSA